MTVFGWVLVVWIAVAAFATIASVGRERKPMDPLTGAVIVAFQAAVVVGVLTIGTGHL